MFRKVIVEQVAQLKLKGVSVLEVGKVYQW
jgi:hypothetical protein